MMLSVRTTAHPTSRHSSDTTLRYAWLLLRAGTAIGCNLLFGWPMLPCILLTGLDALLLLLLVPRQGVRTSEQLTVALLLVVVGCFVVDLFVSAPPAAAVLGGLLPRLQRDSVYTAVCLLGANVMPHNFYLHR
jgi:NRAMP (natural resistance-associated macrophage protein)-like metal ion transporter